MEDHQRIGAPRRAAGHEDRQGRGGSRTIAELAGHVVAPAHGRASDGNGAGMEAAGADLLDRIGGIDGRCREEGVEVALAKLAFLIPSPAPDALRGAYTAR